MFAKIVMENAHFVSLFSLLPHEFSGPHVNVLPFFCTIFIYFIFLTEHIYSRYLVHGEKAQGAIGVVWCPRVTDRITV